MAPSETQLESMSKMMIGEGQRQYIGSVLYALGFKRGAVYDNRYWY